MTVFVKYILWMFVTDSKSANKLFEKRKCIYCMIDKVTSCIVITKILFLKQEHDRNSVQTDLIQGVSHSFYKIKIHKLFSHAYPGRCIQSALRICSFDRGPPLMLSICATGWSISCSIRALFTARCRNNLKAKLAFSVYPAIFKLKYCDYSLGSGETSCNRQTNDVEKQ